jgi:hypothetical protein
MGARLRALRACEGVVRTGALLVHLARVARLLPSLALLVMRL